MSELIYLDKSKASITHFMQWDLNRKLYIENIGLDYPPLFHFCNRKSTEALTVESTIADDFISVEVPNILLQEAVPLIVYLYSTDTDYESRTLYTTEIPVRPRPKPSDYTYVENIDIVTSEVIEQRIKDYIVTSAVAYSSQSATQVYGTLTNPTSDTTYAIPFHTDISTGNKSLRNNDGIKYKSMEGTASENGYGLLILGNSYSSGTDTNKYGSILAYGTNAYYTQLLFGEQTDNRTLTFPDESGTVLTTGGTSFTQALTSGTVIGTLDINGVSYTLYAPTNTDTKNTSGSTDTNSKIYLIGAASQSDSPQTYSHDTVYVGTDGCLYSDNKIVLNDDNWGTDLNSDDIDEMFITITTY